MRRFVFVIFLLCAGVASADLTGTIGTVFDTEYGTIEAATNLASGDVSADLSGFEFGAWMSSLACGCVETDDCPTSLTFVCEPFSLTPVGDFTSTAAAYASDLPNSLCYLGAQSFDATVPTGTSPTQRIEAIPPLPLLSIEAVRWDGTNYAVRYQFSAEYDEYETIEVFVRDSSPVRLHTLDGTIDNELEADDFPLTAAFRSDRTFTKACIRMANPPQNVPEELCVPIREV